MAVSFTQIPAALGDCHTLEGRDSLVSLACPQNTSSWLFHGAWQTGLEAKEKAGGPSPLPRPPLPRVLPLLARAQQAARCGEPSTGPDTTGPGCGPQSVERPWPAHSPFWSSTAPSTQPKTRPSPLTSLRDVQRKHLLGAALLHWSLKQKSAATAELPRDPHQQRGPGLPVGFGCQPSSFWNLGQRQVGRGNSSEQAQRGRLPISLALLPRIRETAHRLQ